MNAWVAVIILLLPPAALFVSLLVALGRARAPVDDAVGTTVMLALTYPVWIWLWVVVVMGVCAAMFAAIGTSAESQWGVWYWRCAWLIGIAAPGALVASLLGSCTGSRGVVYTVRGASGAAAALLALVPSIGLGFWEGAGLASVLWGGAVAVSIVVWGERARRRSRPGVCQNCGYDLAGLPSPICPECGRAVGGVWV